MIYPCPPWSYALSLNTRSVINQTSPHGQAAVNLFPCSALWEDILTGLDTHHPLQLFWTFISLPSTLKAARLPTKCYSPAPGESKGQPLFTQRDEGRRAWIASHQTLYYDFSTVTLLERRLAGEEASQTACCNMFILHIYRESRMYKCDQFDFWEIIWFLPRFRWDGQYHSHMCPLVWS